MMKRSQSNTKRILFLAAAIFLSFSFTSTGQAQDNGQAAKDSLKTTQKSDLKKPKKDVKIFLDKIEILGRIEKPQTVFIIPGKDGAIDDILIDRSFFREIFRSVERDDFQKRIEKSKSK